MNRKWLKEDDDYLISQYGNGKKNDITLRLNRTWASIQSRASKLNIKKIRVDIKGNCVEIWVEEEINFLRLNYDRTHKKILMSVLNRSWSSIQNKAFLLKLKRKNLNANSNKLMDETNEAYYWLGFIMADGHFNTNNQIQINLAEKDLNHLKKFADFVEYKNNLTKPNINIGFGDIRNYLNEKFNISNDKTHYPCNLDKLSGDSFFSFIIGFIDGDGTINTKGYLTLVSHKNWINNICLMTKEISYGNHYSCKVDNSGLSKGIITNIETMKKIKEKIVKLGLPVLERKWSRVEETKLSKKERGIKNKTECLELFNKGLSVKEVIEITKLSRSQVYKQKELIK